MQLYTASVLKLYVRYYMHNYACKQTNYACKYIYAAAVSSTIYTSCFMFVLCEYLGACVTT